MILEDGVGTVTGRISFSGETSTFRCKNGRGSFWDQPLKNEKLRELFEQEELRRRLCPAPSPSALRRHRPRYDARVRRQEKDLYTRIAQLPRSASLRKVNAGIPKMGCRMSSLLRWVLIKT